MTVTDDDTAGVTVSASGADGGRGRDGDLHRETGHGAGRQRDGGGVQR